MPEYKHVLLVTDLRDDSDRVFEKAKIIMGLNPEANVSVLHIVEETVLTAGYEIVPIVPVSNEAEVMANARAKLSRLLEKHEIETKDIHIDSALSTRRGILDYVENAPPDIIVIGRHTRHGLASLLGATADDILPAVSCDVLVVKLGEPV